MEDGPLGPSSRARTPGLHRSGLRRSSRLAFLARAPVPQKLPRINSQLVPVVEVKLDCVLAHAFCRSRFDGGLEHGQSPRGGFRRLSGLLVGFASFLVAQRAGTGIAQERKGIVRLVAVLPLDIETRASAQIHLHRLWVRHCRHEFSIAQRNRAVSQRPKTCQAPWTGKFALTCSFHSKYISENLAGLPYSTCHTGIRSCGADTLVRALGNRKNVILEIEEPDASRLPGTS